LRETAQHLPLDLTIEGVTIFYRNRPYRFTRAIEALIPVITSDVEQFITARSQATTPAHLALIKGSNQALLVEHFGQTDAHEQGAGAERHPRTD
jgi:hypothetical protein